MHIRPNPVWAASRTPSAFTVAFWVLLIHPFLSAGLPEHEFVVSGGCLLQTKKIASRRFENVDIQEEAVPAGSSLLETSVSRSAASRAAGSFPPGQASWAVDLPQSTVSSPSSIVAVGASLKHGAASPGALDAARAGVAVKASAEKAVVNDADVLIAMTSLFRDDAMHNKTATPSDEVPEYQREMFFRPVSVSVMCIIWLTFVGLMSYTSLAIARNYDELSGKTEESWFTSLLEVMAHGTLIAPVLSLLFLATRMYVLAVTHGEGEPPKLLKAWEVIATFGLTLQVLVVLALGIAGAKTASWQGKEEDHVKPTIAEIVQGGVRSMALQYFSVSCLFGGIVIVGFYLLGPMLQAGFSNMSVAVQCTVVITTTYCAVEFAVWMQTHVAGKVEPTGSLAAASSVMQKAPMLAVLFLANRMRFMQYYPPDGTPPLFFRNCIKVVTLALLLEVTIYAYMGKRGTKQVGYYNQATFEVKPRWVHIPQHLAAGAGWVATLMLAISFKRSAEVADAPPMSPTMMSVLALCAVFFSMHALLWLGTMIHDLLQIEMPILRNTLSAATVSVQMCPQLCVLFMAARLRALQITASSGAPQWWEQDCVYLCISAIIVQVFCCLALPIFSGEAASIGPDGTVLYDLRPMLGAYAVTVMKYVALIGIFIGFCGVALAIFMMTPETATQGRVSDREFYSAMLRSGMWVLGLVMVSAILSSAKVIGLAVKFALESVDEMFLGINLTVEKVAVDVRHGYVNLAGLVALNPEGQGFNTDYLLRIGTLRLKINMGRLVQSFGKSFEITELVVEGVALNFERGSAGSNVGHVVAFLESGEADDATRPTPKEAVALKDSSNPRNDGSSSGSTGKEHEQAKDPSERAGDEQASGTEVVLKRLKVSDISATIIVQKIGTLARVALGDVDVMGLELDGANRKTVSFIVGFVMKTILKSAASSAAIMAVLVGQGTGLALGRAASRLCGGCCPTSHPVEASRGAGTP